MYSPPLGGMAFRKSKMEACSPPHIWFSLRRNKPESMPLKKPKKEEVMVSMANYRMFSPLCDPNDPEEEMGLATTLHKSANFVQPTSGKWMHEWWAVDFRIITVHYDDDDDGSDEFEHLRRHVLDLGFRFS
jgi:hypothetical protein